MLNLAEYRITLIKLIEESSKKALIDAVKSH